MSAAGDVDAVGDDIEEIRRLKARYFRLMDQKRWAEWVDVFTEDVHIDTTDDAPDALIDGRDAFRAFLEPLLAEVVTVHHGHMPEIALVGPDEATGVWSMEDHLEWPEGAPMRRLWGTGWYEERYRRCHDGRWRIAELRLRRQRVEVDGLRVFPR
jgi:hypothetical protein